VCVSSACRGLYGGQRVTAVPTATGFEVCKCAETQSSAPRVMTQSWLSKNVHSHARR
jgi:hypothetical protein